MTQLDTATDQLSTWLKDAYAMENAIVTVLEKQVDMTEDLPDIQAGIQRHLDATRSHADTVQRCLESLGDDPSAMKSGMAILGGKLQGFTMGAPEDSLVKNALQDYSTEHMEIASYKALIVAANEAGHTEIASACQTILDDEEQMAAWLDQQIPALVHMSITSNA